MKDDERDLARREDFHHVWKLYAFDDKIAQVNRLSLEDLKHTTAPAWAMSPRVKAIKIATDELRRCCDILQIGLMVGALAPVEELADRLRPFLELRLNASHKRPSINAALRMRFSPSVFGRTYKSGSPYLLLALLGVDSPLSPSSASWFSRLLRLDAVACSKEIGFIVDHSRTEEFVRDSSSAPVFLVREEILKAISTPSEARTLSEQAIVGVETYLYFCLDLYHLLYVSPPKNHMGAFELFAHLFSIPKLNAFVDMMIASCPALDSVTFDAVRRLRMRAVSNQVDSEATFTLTSDLSALGFALRKDDN